MRGKCKKCGKHFDLEMYSGLCPKCGTYNGQHAEGTETSRYISGSYPGKESHKQLQEPKRKLPVYMWMMLFLLVWIPICSQAAYANWEKQYSRQLLEKEVEILQESADGSLVFEKEPLESPVRFAVLEAGAFRTEELEEGEMALAVVKVRVSSEDYNFDARINQVALEYTYEGDPFYREMLSSYNLEEYLDKIGLAKQDVFSLYNIGNDREQEGYFVFAIHAEAENPKLYLSAGSGQGGQVVFLEGRIMLDSFWNANVPGAEETP